MDSELTNTILLSRRDSRAWDALYMLSSKSTYRVLYLVTGESATVLEELNQEVWLSAIESIERFDESRGSAHDWILGIARFKGLSFLRKKYATRLAFVGAFDQLMSISSTDETNAERNELVALVRATIESLPESWQFVLRQKYELDLSVKDIAQLAGISAKAVESTLSRARQRLRELLKETLERTEI